MTKKELAKKISEQSSISHVLALEVVQRVLDGILKTLLDEGASRFRGSVVVMST